MRARIDIDHALVDRNLLGAALGDLACYAPVLIAPKKSASPTRRKGAIITGE
jgi:hypothetical protein